MQPDEDVSRYLLECCSAFAVERRSGLRSQRCAALVADLHQLLIAEPQSDSGKKDPGGDTHYMIDSDSTRCLSSEINLPIFVSRFDDGDTAWIRAAVENNVHRSHASIGMRFAAVDVHRGTRRLRANRDSLIAAAVQYGRAGGEERKCEKGDGPSHAE